MPEADDAQIVGYLLGELSEEDRTRLEERFLRDVEYRELIRAVEDDLIDDYVHGELAPHQRELFEKHFTSVAHRRQKVELAKALTRTLSERRPAPSIDPVPASRRPASVRRPRLPLRVPNPALKYALAAGAVLFFAFGAWFMTQTNGSRTEPEQSQAEQQLPQPQGENPRPSEEQPRESQPGQPPQTSLPKQLAIATLVLPPGLTRESGESRTFVVPSATQLVQLRLPLEKGDEHPAFRAELRTASGDSVWRSGVVQPETGPSGQSVRLELSADLLRSEKYELTLTGINKEVAEDIAHYYFSVVRK